MNDSANPVAKAGISSSPTVRNLTLACIVSLGVAFSLIAFFLTRGAERDRVEQEFDWRTRVHLQALRTNVERFEECLYTLRDLFQSNARVDYAEFQRTALDLRRRHRGVQQLQWVPVVRAQDRAEFEALARKTVFPSHEIIEPNQGANANARARRT